MIKYAIVITHAPEYWYDDWKSEISEDFNEYVVLVGSEEEASWWVDAEDAIGDIEYYEGVEDYILNGKNSYSEHKLRSIYELYQNWPGYTDDFEFIAAVANILYPFLDIETTELRAYRDYTKCAYVSNEIDIDALQDWWAGDVYAVACYELDLAAMTEDEIDLSDLDANNIDDYGSITEAELPLIDTEYWKMRAKGPDNFLAELASYIGYPKEECILIDD